MKKISLVFFVVLLFFSNCYAQKTIGETEFKHIVDYANCWYLMTFIEKNDNGKPYIQNTYNKSVKPILQKAKIENLNNAPSYAEIIKLFPKGTNEIALGLAEKINDRKIKYNSFTDDKSLIESLKTTAWENIDLNQVASIILDSINSKFNIQIGENQIFDQENIGRESIQTSTPLVIQDEQIREFLMQYKNLQKDFNVFRWIVYALIFIILLLIIFLLIKRKIFSQNKEMKLRSFIKEVVLNSREITNRLSSPDNNNGSNLRMYEDKLNALERKIGGMQEILTKIQKNPRVNEVNKNDSESNKEINIEKSEIKFFRSKNGKTLQEELFSDSNASFKVLNIKNNEANFEYCGGVVNLDFFDGVCSFENNPADVPNKTRINTVAQGTVKKDNNNNWVVDKPAKIKFI